MTLIYDIEAFLDAFCVVFKEPNINSYEIFAAFDLINLKDISLPKKYNLRPLNEMSEYVKGNTLVGFNNQAYDNQVLMWIIDNKQYIASEIFKYSTKRIKDTDFDNPNRHLRDYWDNQLTFSYADLYKVNHYDNGARRTGLKKLKFNYRNKNLKELPFSWEDSTDSVRKATDLITYCVDDVDTTEECYIHSHSALKFRANLTEKYRKKGYNEEFYSYSDVKIGDFKNLVAYSEALGLDHKAVKKDIPVYKNYTIMYKDVIPDFIEFKTPQLQQFLKELKQKSHNFDVDSLSEEITYGGVTYTFGEGGIHSVDPPRVFYASDEWIIKDADVGSQYPSEMIKQWMHPSHLGKEWIMNMKKDIVERIEKWKPLGKKGDEDAQAMADLIKLGANGGGYGKLKEKFNWQYDPKVQLQITLSCQLEMLMLAEMLTMNGIQVISANTDGIVVYMHKSKEKDYYKACDEWENAVNAKEFGKLEFADYEMLAQSSVNDYIATYKGGGIKRKGDFLIYEDIKNDAWHKDGSMLIINYALQEYFVNNTPVGQTIMNHNNIFDFCIGLKGTKAFRWLISSVEENGVVRNEYLDDRLLRYYIGGNQTISKAWKDGRGFTRAESSSPVTVAKYLPRVEIDRESDKDRKTLPPYKDLNRMWYIEKAQERIDEIEKFVVKNGKIYK